MKRSVAIIGSGPSALMLGCALDPEKFGVTIYEKNFALARKFLVAGDGGFNLTHSETIEEFVSRYTPAAFLNETIRSFTNEDLREWLKQLGIETYVGTSKRVFPIKGIKPIDVLNAILDELSRRKVSLKTSHEWKGWSLENELIFDHKGNEIAVGPDITVFALGGASWSKTGSDGGWTKLLVNKGIEIIPFQPSNCAYEIKWEKGFISQWEGSSLKNISLSCCGSERKGELVITNFGIEGGAVYGLSPQMRKELNEKKEAELLLDLKPTYKPADIEARLGKKRNCSFTDHIKTELNISGLPLALLKSVTTKEEFLDPTKLAVKIKRLPLRITGMAPINEAISTVGGVALAEIDGFFQIKKLPNHYAIGEMLDWDAPTGGYLLQGCFSMGAVLGKSLNKS